MALEKQIRILFAIASNTPVEPAYHQLDDCMATKLVHRRNIVWLECNSENDFEIVMMISEKYSLIISITFESNVNR